MTTRLEIRPFFDEATKTVTYLVWDAGTRDGAVIDPVLDFDFASGVVDTRSAEQVLAAARAFGVKLLWALAAVWVAERGDHPAAAWVAVGWGVVLILGGLYLARARRP